MRRQRLFAVLTKNLLFSALLGSPVFGQGATGDTLGDVYRSAYVGTLAGKATASSNVAATPPDPFANRVHSSYQDFLNLFNFGIDKVDEAKDGQSLVIRFNPLRNHSQMFSPSLTITKPAIADSISKAIPDAQRSATVATLNGKLGDLDDRTWALSYSFATGEGGCNWNGAGWCWGRKTSAYGDMLALAFAGSVNASESPNQESIIGELTKEFPSGSVFKHKASEASPRAVALIKQLAALDAATKPTVPPEGIDKLASLIDNQPQLAITGSYHDVAQLLGPKESAISAEFQMGRNNNVNWLKTELNKECRGVQKQEDRDQCLAGKLVGHLKALATSGLSTDKFVVTAGYKRRSAYRLDQLVVGTPVTGFTPIDLKQTSEVTAKVQWGLKLGAKIGQKEMRFDLSADGKWTHSDPLRTKSRVVGTATVTLPLGDQMSVPFSLNYANRPEFLTGQRKQLGAHLGLTYRLPWDKNTGSTP